MDFIMPFQESKLRPNLKMAAHRIQLVNSKKENSIKHSKREIVTLLQSGKEEKARIRAEHLIRDDWTIEAYEIIGLLCDLVHERMKHLVNEQECPADLIGTVATLLYAAPRVEISELETVRKQLVKKYGKKFVEEVIIPERGYVNPRVVEKLAVRPPSAEAVIRYLQKVAEEFNVDWTPTDIGITDRGEAIASPSGYSVPMAPGTHFGDVYHNSTEQTPPPSYADANSHISVPPPAYTAYAISKNEPTYSAAGVKIRDTTKPSSAEYDNDTYNNGDIGSSPPQTVSSAYLLPPQIATAVMEPEFSLPEAPAAPSINIPAAPGDTRGIPSAPGYGSQELSYDDLAARFNALSK